MLSQRDERMKITNEVLKGIKVLIGFCPVNTYSVIRSLTRNFIVELVKKITKTRSLDGKKKFLLYMTFKALLLAIREFSTKKLHVSTLIVSHHSSIGGC